MATDVTYTDIDSVHKIIKYKDSENKQSYLVVRVEDTSVIGLNDLIERHDKAYKKAKAKKDKVKKGKV